jgi:hypothetical protein
VARLSDVAATKTKKQKPRGLQPDYVSFERHLEIYMAVSGDRERFVGFDRRYETLGERASARHLREYLSGGLNAARPRQA